MTSPALIFSLGLMLLASSCTNAWPQDLGTGMMLAMGQVQQLADTGGGLVNQYSGEIMGQPVAGGLNLGIGQAMSQLPMGRRRRSSGTN